MEVRRHPACQSPEPRQVLTKIVSLLRLLVFMVFIYLALGWVVERRSRVPDSQLKAFFRVLCSPVTAPVSARATSANAHEATVLAAEYRDLEERYAQIQAEIRRKSPRYAALAKPQPLSLKEVQQQVLDADTVLLEYALGEERSYLWAVSEKEYTSHELPKRATIEQAARRVYEQLTAGLTTTGDPTDRRRRIAQADAESGTRRRA